MKFGIKLGGNHNYVLYDEFDVTFEADFAIDEEVLVGNIHSLLVTMAEHSDKSRRGPIYDTLGTTYDEYKEFWQGIITEEQRWKQVFNQVLSAGIPLPYWNLSFLTEFTFHPHALIVVMDIFYNNVEIFKH